MGDNRVIDKLWRVKIMYARFYSSNIESTKNQWKHVLVKRDNRGNFNITIYKSYFKNSRGSL